MTSRHEQLPRTDQVRHPDTFRLSRLRPTARTVIRRRFKVVLHHPERVPMRGPVVFAANHVGVIDGPVLAIFSPRPVHALTKREMFEGRMGRFLLKAGQIPVDRFQTDPLAVKTSLRVLRDGGAVGIFPEGGRGAGELDRFHRGAAYLAMVTGAPIVPVIMVGTREPGGHSNSMPPRGSVVEMVYGEPIHVEQSPWPRTRSAVGDVSRRLRERMLQDLDAALELTGRQLPGPLPKGEREPDPGGGVTEKSA
jgi:1-acyl-sn-glycerol-3-phosphate acyltransferase